MMLPAVTSGQWLLMSWTQAIRNLCLCIIHIDLQSIQANGCSECLIHQVMNKKDISQSMKDVTTVELRAVKKNLDLEQFF